MIPRITVVTPSFNQGQFLAQTIRSVLDQNYPNLEYIIIDGGSTDHSVEVIKNFESSLAYWVSEPDDGQYAAINKGFERATGEIFCYLNSDDYFLPGALERVGRAYQENPDLRFLHGRVQFVDQSGNPSRSHLGNLHSLFDILDLWGHWWNGRQWIQPECFWKREDYIAVGGFNESLFMVGDWDFWVRLFDRSNSKPLTLDCPLVCFREHPDQKTVDRSRVAREQLDLLGEYLDSSLAGKLSQFQYRYLKSEWLYSTRFLPAVEQLVQSGTSKGSRWLSLLGLILRNPQLCYSASLLNRIFKNGSTRFLGSGAGNQ